MRSKRRKNGIHLQVVAEYAVRTYGLMKTPVPSYLDGLPSCSSISAKIRQHSAASQKGSPSLRNFRDSCVLLFGEMVDCDVG